MKPKSIFISVKGESASGGKKIIFILSLLTLLAAGCAKVQLKQEVPQSPPASYHQLPQ